MSLFSLGDAAFTGRNGTLNGRAGFRSAGLRRILGRRLLSFKPSVFIAQFPTILARKWSGINRICTPDLYSFSSNHAKMASCIRTTLKLGCSVFTWLPFRCISRKPIRCRAARTCLPDSNHLDCHAESLPPRRRQSTTLARGQTRLVCPAPTQSHPRRPPSTLKKTANRANGAFALPPPNMRKPLRIIATQSAGLRTQRLLSPSIQALVSSGGCRGNAAPPLDTRHSALDTRHSHVRLTVLAGPTSPLTVPGNYDQL